MVTLFFQPHQHSSAASQNNGCLGLHCLTAVDDETNFMDQLVAGGDTSFLSQLTMSRGNPACRPGPGSHISCTPPGSPQFGSIHCEPINRVSNPTYACRRMTNS
ncbi:RALF [Medicago truncatula]|nr:RALF [Medicago truncatula]